MRDDRRERYSVHGFACEYTYCSMYPAGTGTLQSLDIFVSLYIMSVARQRADPSSSLRTEQAGRGPRAVSRRALIAYRQPPIA